MIKKLMVSIFVLIFLFGITPINVFAQDEKLVTDEEKPIEEKFTPIERVDMYTENGRTTQIGTNTFSLDTSIGVVNYKDDYLSSTEQWKEIDLTPVVAKDGTISVKKAPYELTIKGLEVFVKDKKTGATTTLTLSDLGEGLSSSKVSTPSLDTSAKGMATAKNIATDTDLEISWENSRIKYTRILKSANAPVTAKYAITETGTTKIALTAQAVDSKTEDDKSVAVIYENQDGVLTETIDSKIAVTYPLRVDPTLDISTMSRTDECTFVVTGNDSFLATGAGAPTFGEDGLREGMASIYRLLTIPSTATITVAYITLTSLLSLTADTVRLKIQAQQSTDALTFTTGADYHARTLTTAGVDWDFTTDWTAGSTYNTADFSSVISELISDYTGLSSANIMINIEDDLSTAGAYRRNKSYGSGGASVAPILHIEYTSPICVLTGTITTATNSDVASGGKTIILTLTNDTWVADGATFNAQRQNIINGIVSTIGVYQNTGGTITTVGANTVHTFTNVGFSSFTAYRSDNVSVQCWGAGGGGGFNSGIGGGGGGGGAYAATSDVSVTANTIYPVVVGMGGTRIQSGVSGSSLFGTTTVVALGGTGVNSNGGGAGGVGASGTGTTKYSGGAGKNAHTTGDVGGGGGGAGGKDGNGVDGTAAIANVGGAGGAGDNGSGGAGGASDSGGNGTSNALGGGGGAGNGSDAGTGGNGGEPGGGGAGTDNSAAGATGGNGQVVVTCVTATYTPTGTTTNAWNAEVKAKAPVTDVVRTSSTVVTITLSAQAGYAISENETMTVTIPATAVTSAVAIVASPNFTITYSAVAPTYDITNDPASKAFGIVAASSTYYAKGSAPSNPVADGDCTYTLTNAGNSSITVNIHGHNFTGGAGWALGGSVGSNTVKITAYRSGIDPASGVVLTTSDQELVHEIAASGHTHWDFKFDTGTFTDGVAKRTTLTLTSVAH